MLVCILLYVILRRHLDKYVHMWFGNWFLRCYGLVQNARLWRIIFLFSDILWRPMHDTIFVYMMLNFLSANSYLLTLFLIWWRLFCQSIRSQIYKVLQNEIYLIIRGPGVHAIVWPRGLYDITSLGPTTLNKIDKIFEILWILRREKIHS